MNAAILSAATLWVLAATAPDQTTQPASPLAPEVEAILDRQEARDKTLVSLSAKFKYVKVQKVVDERTQRDGSIRFLRRQAPNPAPGPDEPAQVQQTLFRIQFDTLVTEGYVSTKKETYVFDGQCLHELRETTKELTHRYVAPQNRFMNPTQLGAGPFPAPFGQKKQDVLDNFTVALIPPAKADTRPETSGLGTADDPKDTDHLELIPRPGTDLARTYKKIDLFISRSLDLPVRMVLENKGREITTMDFRDIRINGNDVSESDFRLARPPDYKETTIPLSRDTD